MRCSWCARSHVRPRPSRAPAAAPACRRHAGAGSARLRLPSTARSLSKMGAATPMRPAIDLAAADAAAGPPDGGEAAAELLEPAPSPAPAISAGMVREQGLQGAGRQMRQDDLRGGAAVERHQAAALIAHRLLRPSAHDLMHAHDPVVEQPAQQHRRSFGGMRRARSIITARAPIEHGVAGLDQSIHLDDGGSERIAGPRHRADQSGLGQLLKYR